MAAVAAVISLYAFGRTTAPDAPKPGSTAAAPAAGAKVAPARFEDLLAKARQSLSSDMQMRITGIENSVTRGEVRQQQLEAYHQLAGLWDSLGHAPIAAHYLGEAAKLENSEKSLTFAANLFLAHLQHSEDAAVQAWEAAEARQLLEKALALNPTNDTIQVALAGSEVAGGEVMQGVQRLLKITEKDPNNLQANLMLGRLSVTSGQYDKAVARLEKVVAQAPENTEALYFLAEAYKGHGDTEKAIKTFERCKQLVNDPAFSKEIDNYINSFK